MLASRSAGIILQVLLAGGTDRNTLGVTMIGAMPAVAVRQERRKQEKKKRPSQLYLGGLILRQSPPSRANSLTPSPLQSPPDRRDNNQEFYLFGKVSLLHMVVVSLLLGAILLIVGLVQLKPGAHDSQHRYYLMAAGSFLMLLGFLLTAVRCCILPWRMRKREEHNMRNADSHMSGMSHAHGSHGSDNDRNAQLENGRSRKSIDVRSDKIQIHSPVGVTLQETGVSGHDGHKAHHEHGHEHGHESHGHNGHGHGATHGHDSHGHNTGSHGHGATHGHDSHGHEHGHGHDAHHGSHAHGHETYCHDTHGHATHSIHARDMFYDTHGHGRFGVIPCEKIT